jgi:CheY-like chemotaxis protein
MVDDDEIQLAIAKTVLNADYEVFTAKSGKEALTLIYKGFLPDLILLDILMPEMDGWETYNRFKAIALLHSVPIAFITSENNENSINRARELKASDYITKPYSSIELLERVNKLFCDNNGKAVID